MLGYSNAFKQAAANALISTVNVGVGTAKIRIYDVLANLLVEFDLSVPALVLSGNEAAMPSPVTGTAGASGTTDNFELLDEAGSVVMTGSCSESGDLVVDNAIIIDGESCQIMSFSWGL